MKTESFIPGKDASPGSTIGTLRKKPVARGFQLNESSLLHGVEAVQHAEALLDRSERFFGLETLGADMQGSAMHQALLAAYDKLLAPDNGVPA